MKLRFLLFGALSFLALITFAKVPRWYTQPGTAVTLETAGFELRTMMPQGWSYTKDEGFVPPPDLASSCRVRVVFHTDRNWDRFLLSALRDVESDERYVLKVGGHPSVSSHYARDDRMFRKVYINLSDLQPDSAAVWTFERSPTPEGADCELQFAAIIASTKIELTERRRPAG